ncbi:hypothetical protein F2Q70_00028037 [Brassica cretica]|uniref:Dirigent protein n=1 Tax=Brassica cretica TaxID=69181 RepID=A0A8S9I9Y0_BRACR|nr:hypothetical protein F2Q68_00027621 [Brassica cretica]KAF2605241.1 hypothetical protein F2Q70_00028037 [Brassica cretica]
MAGQKILSFLVLTLLVSFTAAARLLDEEDTFPATTTPGSGPFPGPLPASGSGSVGTGSGSAGTGFSSGTGSIPTSGSAGAAATGLGAGTGPGSSSGSRPLTTTGSGPLPIAGSVPGPLPVNGGPGSLPATGGSSTGPGQALGGGAGAGTALGGGGVGPDHTLVFFMHDILGGSNPTARAVTGVVANPALSGQLPFAKPNGANLPITNGVPANNNNNGIVNNNNVPLLVGLGGTTANILQNNGNNGNNNLLNGLPVANGGQLPSGSALQMLMFGTMTVIDDELTEGHELGSGLLGKAQGYYVASAVDGTSQTMAFTAMFESGGYEDSISFFGVHRTAASESHLGVMGGTGKYVNARGFAIVKTFTGSSGTQQQQPHQFTDGLETVLQCTVYLSY